MSVWMILPVKHDEILRLQLPSGGTTRNDANGLRRNVGNVVKSIVSRYASSCIARILIYDLYLSYDKGVG